MLVYCSFKWYVNKIQNVINFKIHCFGTSSYFSCSLIKTMKRVFLSMGQPDLSRRITAMDLLMQIRIWYHLPEIRNLGFSWWGWEGKFIWYCLELIKPVFVWVSLHNRFCSNKIFDLVKNYASTMWNSDTFLVILTMVFILVLQINTMLMQ